MKNRAIILALALTALAACQKTEQEGGVSFTVVGGEVAEIATKGNVSDYATLPSPGDFQLSVVNSSNTSVYDGLLSGWSADTKLAAGNYKATVTCGQTTDEGPAKPAFAGEASFAVNGGAKTEVEIKATLSNCIVKIVCTDAFKAYYPAQTFSVTTPYNTKGFDWNGQALFVAYQFTVAGSVISQAGTSYELQPKPFKGKPATCYTVKYDVTNVGGVSVSVSFSDEVETVTLEEIELNS